MAGFMEKDFSSGKMVLYTKVIMKMIKSMDLANILTNKVKISKDTGKMVFDMGRVP